MPGVASQAIRCPVLGLGSLITLLIYIILKGLSVVARKQKSEAERQRDNWANALNKRLENAERIFGINSEYYEKMQNIISANVPDALVRRANKQGEYTWRISRGAALKNVSNEDIYEVDKWIKANSTIDYKKKLRAEAKKITGRNKVEADEIKLMAEIMSDMSNALSEALNYFYDYDAESEEYEEAMNIVRRAGKRTYDEIYTVLDYAEKSRTEQEYTIEGFDFSAKVNALKALKK